MGGRLYDAIDQGRVMAGETIAATLEYDDCPRSEGWTLAVNFRGAYSGAQIACTDGTGANEFALTVPAATTLLWRGGRYAYVVMATKTGTGTVCVERGVVAVAPNPTTATPAMTILAAIDALVLGRATDDQKTIAIDGTQMQYMSVDQLQRLRETYRNLVETEIREMGGGGGIYAIQHHACEDHRLAAPWPFGYTGRAG
jgi:hypothetical protein